MFFNWIFYPYFTVFFVFSDFSDFWRFLTICHGEEAAWRKCGERTDLKAINSLPAPAPSRPVLRSGFCFFCAVFCSRFQRDFLYFSPVFFRCISQRFFGLFLLLFWVFFFSRLSKLFSLPKAADFFAFF